MVSCCLRPGARTDREIWSTLPIQISSQNYVNISESSNELCSKRALTVLESGLITHTVNALESGWVGYLNDFIWRTTKGDADKEGPPSLSPTHPNNGDAIGATLKALYVESIVLLFRYMRNPQTPLKAITTVSLLNYK